MGRKKVTKKIKEQDEDLVLDDSLTLDTLDTEETVMDLDNVTDLPGKRQYADPMVSNEEVLLSEIDILKFRLINTQSNFLKKSMENEDLKKQIILLEQKTVLENFEAYKKHISEEYEVDFNDYIIDVENQKLMRKKVM